MRQAQGWERANRGAGGGAGDTRASRGGAGSSTAGAGTLLRLRDAQEPVCVCGSAMRYEVMSCEE